VSDENASLRDVLGKIFQEHCTRSRHHQIQRSKVIGTIVAVSAAIIGIITFDKTIAAPADLPLAFLLIVLGVFGAGFAMKHYERFNFHMERARSHRDALDALLPGQSLQRLNREADSAHEKKFPRMHKWRLYYWWLTLNLIVALIGATLLVIAIWFPIKAAP
jgi:Ca2+/Na+ antiporter